jgi:hypothetical protein
VDGTSCDCFLVEWSGFQKQYPVEALGVKVSSPYAFWLSIVAFVVANALVLILLLRLGDLVRLVDDTHFLAAFGKLSLHPWPLNPFAYFGKGIVTRLQSAFGFSALIVVWWVCCLSICIFAYKSHSYGKFVLLMGFLVVGVASMAGIIRVMGLVLKRTEKLYVDLNKSLIVQGRVGMISVCLGAVIGDKLSDAMLAALARIALR